MSECSTIVQLVQLDSHGDACQRMSWPAEHLARQAPSWRVINLDARSEFRWEWALEADLLVLIQCGDPDLFGIIAERKKMGRKTLVEYNDNFYEPQPWSPIVAAWSNPLLWQTYEEFIRVSDGLIVTGEGLFDLFSQKFNKPIYILRNHFHETPRSFEELWDGKGEKEFKIGWAGSLGHMADILSISPLLDRLSQKFPQVRIHLMGNESIPALARISEQSFRFKKWGSMNEYFDFWSQVHVGVAPLLDTSYNRCRSDAKAIEMSSMGVLPVLPDAYCYKSFLASTEIRPFSDQTSLEQQLISYIENPRAVMDSAREIYNWVVKNRHHSAQEDRLQLYEKHLPRDLNHHFRWPMESGYHSIVHQEAPPRIGKIIERGLQMAKSGNPTEAINYLSHERDKVVWNSDLELFLLKLKVRSGERVLLTDISKMQMKYPFDLRFSLLSLQLATGDDLSLVWRELINKIQELQSQVALFFTPDILKQIKKDLRESKIDIGIAESLLEVLPGKPALLRFELAEAYERANLFERAAQLFHELNEEKKNFSANQAFFSGIEGYYLEAWNAALRSRASKIF